MQKLLSEYRSAIEQFHPALLASLRSGLNREVVIEQLARLPFEISDEAIEFYCWADGMEDCSECLIPYSYFMPLETAIQQFENLLPMQLDDNFPQKFRQSFPILSDGSDGGYGLGAIDEPCLGRVISYNIHEEWTIGFNSLSDLITTAIDAYKRGLVDDDGEWRGIQFSDLVEELYPELKPESAAESRIKITAPDGWYLSSDRSSLTKDETMAFLVEYDTEAFENLRLQLSRTVKDLRAKAMTENTESEVRIGDSEGWKFVFGQIEVSELIQVNYLLTVPGGHIYVTVHSNVTVFDDVEFETALETLQLTAATKKG